jgi:ribosomal protein RSM22 (predicted rRNA methylase)
MLIQERIDYITDLLKTIEESLRSEVDKFPEKWRGTDIRHYIADMINPNTTPSIQYYRDKNNSNLRF